MLSMGNPRGRGLYLKGEFGFRSRSDVMSAGCIGRSGAAFGREGMRCEKMVMVRWNVELITAFHLHLSFHLHCEPSLS
jgi:hypothetical protein